MTLPPEKLGDQGQRYEVRCFGYPEDGDNVIGWTNSRPEAERMRKGILLAPGANRARVIDRKAEP